MRTSFVTALVASACALMPLGCGDNDSSTGGPTATFDSAELNDGAARIAALVSSSELIFVGTVQSVDEAPPIWSGFAEARQGVAYEVSQRVKGSYAGSTLTVGHLLIESARQAQTDGTVGLSPSVFAVGSRLIVLVETLAEDQGEDASENFSAIPYSSVNLAAIQALM